MVNWRSKKCAAAEIMAQLGRLGRLVSYAKDKPPPKSDRGRAGVTKSIRSIYADYGTQRQQVAIPSHQRRIKAGRATAI